MLECVLNVKCVRKVEDVPVSSLCVKTDVTIITMVSCALQDSSNASNLLSRSAFRNAILAERSMVLDARIERLQPAQDKIIIRFQLWYAAPPVSSVALFTWCAFLTRQHLCS